MVREKTSKKLFDVFGGLFYFFTLTGIVSFLVSYGGMNTFALLLTGEVPEYAIFSPLAGYIVGLIGWLFLPSLFYLLAFKTNYGKSKYFKQELATKVLIGYVVFLIIIPMIRLFLFNRGII